MTFYNTIGHQGDELKEAQKATENQDTLVMKIINENQGKDLTPRIIWSKLKVKAQLTSVRRSITNLVAEGRLEYGDKIKHVCPVDQFQTTERTIKLPKPKPVGPGIPLTLFD